MTHFNVSSHHEGETLVVVCEGELDIAAAATVRESLAQRTAQQALVIDLSGLAFLDTSGIQVVVEAYRAAREEGFELRLRRAAPRVHRIFEIAGLDKTLPFEDGPANA